MPGFEAGQAFISVSPSFRNFNQKVRAQLKKELAGVSGEIPIQPDFDGLKPKAKKAGAEAGGEFARTFRRRVDAALKALPDIQIGADTSEADTEIAGLRTRLQALRDLRIGVDIDASDANRELQEIRAQLARINAEDSRVDVRADTAAAMAQLAAVDAEVSKLDGRDATVNVDVDPDGGALRSAIFLHTRISSLALAGAAIGPALVPGLAAATVAAGGLVSALGAATVGVGALIAASIPSITAVSEALQAQEAAEKSAVTSTAQLARQRLQNARAAEQAALRVADARRNAARVAEDGARRVADAERGVADAERELARAQENERRVQESLTQARRDAALALDDLRERTSDIALSQEAAEIALIEARQRQTEVEEDANSTALDRRKAALEVAQAEDRLSDVRRDQARTTEELQEAERKGVNGSDLVVDARRRLEEANLATADAARNVQDAERELAQAQQDAARASADAARLLSEALAAQTQQQQLARLEAQQGTAAQRNLAFAMGELTPMQRRLMQGWIGLRDAFTQWSRSLEPAIVPVFLEGMRLIERILPLLTPIVLAAAGAFGDLLEQAGDALESPFWQEFFGWLADTAGPSIETFGLIIGNLATGFAGLMMAFGPMAASIGQGLVGLSERFAQWGATLESNQSFQDFVAFVRENWPQLRDTLSALGSAMANIITAMAPLGGPVLFALEAIANVISVMPPELIVAIAGALFGMSVAIKAVALGMALLNANPIVAIISVLAALVLLFIHAYKESETFRAVVNYAMKLVGDRISWIWNNILKPVFNFLGAAFRTVWDIAKEVGRGIANAWDRLSDDLGEAWDWIWRNVIKPLKNGFQDAWDKAVEIKDGILKAFRAIRDTVGGIFESVIDNIKAPIRGAFKWINDNLISNLNKITTKFGLEIPELPEKFHSGGVIPGRGERVITALGGEGVVSPKGMKAIGGKHGLDAINRGAHGGPIDWIGENVISPIGRGLGAIGSQIGDWLKQGAAFALDKLFDLVVPAAEKVMPQRPEFAHAMVIGGLKQLHEAVVDWGEGRDALEDGAKAGRRAPGGISKKGWAWVVGRPYFIGRGPLGHGYPAQDLPAPTGTPIYSATSGTVIQSLDSNYSYGRRVMIDHGAGLRGVYAHMSTRIAQLGDMVRAGQMIGRVGSTGNSTGPHLHLEIGDYDPLSFLRRQGVSFDTGGYLPPGLTLAYNGTGGHERVLDRGQTRAYERGGTTYIIQSTTEEQLAKIRTAQSMRDLTHRRAGD